MKCKKIIFWGQKHTWWKIIWFALCASIFLLAAYTVAYRDTDLWNLWLPASDHSDAVSYNRQLAGVLKYGQPQGYFGYNETHAELGPFGTWGPLVIYLYAIPGVLFGSGNNTMFWCNVFFAVVGWGILVYGMHLTWKKQIVFAVLVSCVWLPIQQVFTGTAEVSQYFLVFVFLGACAFLQREWNLRWYILMVLSGTLTVGMRFYTVVLWMCPISILWGRKRRWAFVSAILAISSMILYVFLSNQCAAPYFEGNGVDYTAFELLFEGQITESFSYQLEKIASQWEIFRYLYVEPMKTGQFSMQGIAFLGMAFLFAATALSVAIDLLRKREVRIRISALIFALLAWVAMLAVYKADPMGRHLILLSVVLLAACVYEFSEVYWLCAPALLFPILISENLVVYKLPTYDSYMGAQFNIVQEALQNSEIKNDEIDPWTHTIAYSMDDTFFGYLYAIPDGMGFQFDLSEYLANPENSIHSHYVMTKKETDVEARLLTEGWQELVSTEDLIVYERPDDVQ